MGSDPDPDLFFADFVNNFSYKTLQFSTYYIYIFFFPVGKSTSGKQVENHSHCPRTGGGDSTIIILRWKGDNMF